MGARSNDIWVPPLVGMESHDKLTQATTHMGFGYLESSPFCILALQHSND